MNKKEMTFKGFELVGYSGEARSYLLEALMHCKAGKFDEIEKLLAKAQDSITLAHSKQTDLLFEEAKGNYSDPTMTMVHGQDHLMTTLLLKELLPFIIELYRSK